MFFQFLSTKLEPTSQVVQWKRIPKDAGGIPGSGRSPGEGNGDPLQYLGLPCSSDGKESACSAEDLCLIPGLGKSPGEGNGYPLQYSRLQNPMERGTCWATVRRVAKSWMRD